jgi:hypothetical protein
MRWAGAPRACQPISFSPLKGPSRDPRGGSCPSPNVHRLPPVAGWTQSGIDPMRVEAGLNRLLLPSPARLRPADNRQHPLHPTDNWGGPAWPRLGALALCQAGVEGSRCASPRPERSFRPGIAVLMRRAVAAVAAPASQTGRSHFLPGPRPRRRMPFASPGGRRGDVPLERQRKDSRYHHPDPRQCRGVRGSGQLTRGARPASGFRS